MQSGVQVFSDTGVGNYGLSDEGAWFEAACGHCSGAQHLVIARQSDNTIRWLRCASCRQPSVWTLGVMYPGTRPLRLPSGVPSVEATVWEEVRNCLGVGANTAAVMLCRKLLFHIAVTHGLPAKNEKGWAPTYEQAVKHLEKEGLFTPKMRRWVDRIKDVGNEANHEIEPISARQALDVATFTEQLLVLAYELDARMDDPAIADDQEPGEQT